MNDIAIRVGGTAAEICAEPNGNVVKLRPRQGRAAAPPFAHRSRIATTTDAAQSPVRGSTDDATTLLLSIALLWFERFLLAGPRLTTGEYGMTLSGTASQVSFTAVRAPSEWCVVTPARLRC
jgi:hypothetical protein